MPAPPKTNTTQRTILDRRPAAVYFLLTFAISWTGALAVALPSLLRGVPLPRLNGILVFPAMLLGPLLSGLLMSRLADGPAGMRLLIRRMFEWRAAPGWYGLLLLPPVFILTILTLLARFKSPAFAPNHFWLGAGFGVPAGICEEIGWMGFAFPHMRSRQNAFSTALTLGIIWSAWHLPAINFLGASAPHGRAWPAYFFGFAAVMTAMRVLIAWLYVNTDSLLLAQLMHISSTGALVIFSPPVTSISETAWYLIYAGVLWMVVTIVVLVFGSNLRTRRFAKSAVHAG